MTGTLPSDWARLHKLSPVLRSARGLAALAIVLGPRQFAPGQHQPPWVDLAVVGLAAVAGVVSWLVTRWRLQNGELQIETGLVRRQSLRVPLTRLQAVDVVRPLLARMLGLAEVRIVVAGHGSAHTRLAYLTEERAREVRAQLLALAHGLAHDTPEPVERPVLSVPGGRVVAANLLAGPVVAVVALVAASVTVIAAAPRAAPAVASSAFAVAVALALAAARQMGAEWEFTVAEAPDGVRLRSGLLQTRAETIPHGRTQAVRWVEPLLWRPFGWVRLEIDVARRHDHDRSERASAATTRTLLPVGGAEEARWLLSRVLPGASVVPPGGSGPPGRAWWRAPLSRHYLGAWYDGAHVACRTGRVRPAVVVVPLEKMQSLRWTQGPVSRLLRLASVHVDTAGHRFAGSARFRDADEADEWAARLPELARAARSRATAGHEPGPAG